MYSSILFLFASACLFAPYKGSEDDSGAIEAEVVLDSGDSAEVVDTADTGEFDTDTGEVTDTGSQDSGSGDTADSGSDGSVDTGVRGEYDNDGDGFCEGTVPCSTEGAWPGDCNDDYSGDNPAAIEVCGDNRDNDCDGNIDDGCDSAEETDTGAEPEDSGTADSGDSGDTATSTDSGACVDDDCDGDGFAAADDCNDTDENINPGAVELCDEHATVDEDCDGEVNEGDVCTITEEEIPAAEETDTGDTAEEDADAPADTEDTDTGADEAGTEVPADSVDSTDTTDSGDSAEEEVVEAVEPTVDSDGDGYATLCWIVPTEWGATMLGDLENYNYATGKWDVLDTESGSFNELCGTVDITYGFLLAQGEFYNFTDVPQLFGGDWWIASNYGDLDGDGADDLEVAGTFTLDDLAVTVAAVTNGGGGANAWLTW